MRGGTVSDDESVPKRMGAYPPEYYAPSSDFEDADPPDLPQRTRTVAHDAKEEQERAHAVTFLDSILAHLKANYGIPDTASNRENVRRHFKLNI